MKSAFKIKQKAFSFIEANKTIFFKGESPTLIFKRVLTISKAVFVRGFKVLIFLKIFHL